MYAMTLGTIVGSSRMFAAVCAIAAASAPLMGCGGGQTATGAAQGARQAAAASSATREASAGKAGVTRAQSRAFARAVNLTAADVPEARVATRTPSPRLSASEIRQLARCERPARSPRASFAALSAPLTRGKELETEEIRSYVVVLAGGRDASAQLGPLRTSAVRECVAAFLTRHFAEKSVAEARWGRFNLSELPVGAPGSQGTLGWRGSTTLSLTFSEVTVPIYVDVLGFATGPVFVALIAASPTQPVPVQTEQRLVSLLLSRALAHPL